MRWLQGEWCYLKAWTWIACGILLKHAGLGLPAVGCFKKGVDCATRATVCYGAKP